MSIQEFKSNLLGGGARPNQFRVELVFPGFVKNGTEAGRTSQFLCTAASLPGSTIGVAPVFYRGRKVPLAGDREFQPWSITVLNDTNFLIRNAFEEWSNQINELQYNTGITNPSAYTADLQVHQLDRNGAILKSYKFIGAWPADIGEIGLDFSDNDKVEQFRVQLVYSHYVTDFQSKSGASVTLNTPIGGITL